MTPNKNENYNHVLVNRKTSEVFRKSALSLIIFRLKKYFKGTVMNLNMLA